MSVEAGVAYQFVRDILLGTHNLNTASLKIALYNSSSAIATDMQAGYAGVYSSTGELTSTNYTAGGQAVTHQVVWASGALPIITVNAVTWTALTGTIDAAVLYNTSAGNRVITVISLGSSHVLSGTDVTLNLGSALEGFIQGFA